MSAFRSWPGRFGRFEKSFLVAAFCGFATTASFAEEPKGAVPTQVPVLRVPLSNDWKIEIVPGPAIGPSAYAEVYNSIPFRRSEYLVNPSYRHDATIELMLGQIRPTTVTNVMVTQATCCWPQTATFSPWGAYAFDFRKSRFRP